MELSVQEYNRIGEERYNAGDIEGAKEAFERAIAIDSKSSVGLNNLGIILLHEKNLDNAFLCFLKANAADAANLNILSNLATCGRELGLWAAVAGVLQHSLSFHPKNADLLFLLGTFYLKLGKKKEARQLLAECLRIQPEFSEASELISELDGAGEMLEKTGEDLE
ncbi:MAG: tetratricopeptide repeat protein [Deltaproteobacteria bacterium]|nr:tetratricopeptide repeat protein [Deltaproteobacteria bacterium]MBW2020265.1 tetratricopeptide repeat protein [Deltaproteobacteria bacterium]MBW2073123.1 tetratricopeptide repeat protein [Deltaproteobacteria bacterium]